MFRIEFRKLFRGEKLWIAMAVSVLIAVVPFFSAKRNISGRIFLTPENCCLLYDSAIGILLILFFTSLLASFPYACAYHEEKRNHTEPMSLTRSGRNSFYLSKLLVVVVSGFVISIVPFLLNYLLCLIAFPRPDAPPTDALNFIFGNVYSRDYFRDLGQVLFPRLFLNHPVLDVLTHIFLVGIWGAGCAVLTYAFSLIYHRHLVVTAVLPSLLVMISLLVIMETLGNRWCAPLQLMLAPRPGDNASTLGIVCFLLLIPFLIGGAVLSYRLLTSRGRDEL